MYEHNYLTKKKKEYHSDLFSTSDNIIIILNVCYKGSLNSID